MNLLRRVKASSAHPSESHFAPQDEITLEYLGKSTPTSVCAVGKEGLWIVWPSHAGALLEVSPGVVVTITSSARSGAHPYLAQVEELIKKDPPLLWVRLQQSLGSDQRRNFTRVPDALPVKIWSENGRGSTESSPLADTVTRDLSGGGMRIIIENRLCPAKSEKLALKLQLPEGDPISAGAIVIRTDPVDRAGEKCRVALRFTRLNERDRKRIIQRVYARQAELHQRGLL